MMSLKGKIGILSFVSVVILSVAALSGCGSSNTTASPVPTAIPVAPVIASAAAGNTQNTITWATVTGATSYNLYWTSNAAASATLVASGTKIAGVISPYAHTGLTNATTYFYVTTAVNAAGESNPSNVVSATPTAAAAPAPTIASFAPTSGAVGAAVTITGTNFSATAASNTVTFNGTAATVSAATATQLTTSVPTGATTGNIAVATNGQGASSYPVSRTFTVLVPPAAPTGVTATPISNNNTSAAITWNAVTGATSYNIYYSTVAANATKAAGTKITGATPVAWVPGLTSGTTYYFVVTAVNAGGESVESSPVASLTPGGVNIYAGITLLPAGIPAGLGAPQSIIVTILNWNGTGVVSTATVTVNGVNIPYNATTSSYQSNPTITPGATYTMNVTIPGDLNIYTATGTMFSGYPGITSPANNFVWASTSAQVVNWNNPATAAGDQNMVMIIGSNGGMSRYPGMGGATIPLATSFTFPANSIAAGTNPSYLVVGATRSVPIPNANGGLNLGAMAPLVSGTIN